MIKNTIFIVTHTWVPIIKDKTRFF